MVQTRFIAGLIAIPVTILVIFTILASRLLPADLDRHYQLDVHKRGHTNPASTLPTIYPTLERLGNHTLDGAEKHLKVEAQPATTNVLMRSEPKDVGADLAWVDALDLDHHELAVVDATGCETRIRGETDASSDSHPRTVMLREEGRWPASGPGGGGEVYVLPHTQAARTDRVHCRIGTSVLRGGYDALHDWVVCTCPPRTHVVQSGETLSLIATKYGLMSLPEEYKNSILDIGQVLVLQQTTVSVVLADVNGVAMFGESVMKYAYFLVDVVSVEPQAISTAGGVTVTVTGKGFDTVVPGDGKCGVRCSFGSSVQVPAVVMSATTVTCIAPPLPTVELDQGGPESVGVLSRSVHVGVSLNGGADFSRSEVFVSYYRRVVCIRPDHFIPSNMQQTTIFAVPKPFKHEYRDIQRNAIRSWKRLRPAPRVILLGDEEGVGTAAKELGVLHVPNVQVNEQGTPLLNSTFALALAKGGDVMIFVNSDIMLFDDIMLVVSRVREQLGRFLVVGRRVNANTAVTKKAKAAKNSTHWNHVRRLAATTGVQHTRWAQDYFAWSRDLFDGVSVPPFAIGRPAYDNWIVRTAIERGFRVVDGSSVVLAVHQQHSYAHVDAEVMQLKTGKEEAEWLAATKGKKETDVWETMHSQEIDMNFKLAGDGVKLGTTDHATWVAMACP